MSNAYERKEDGISIHCPMCSASKTLKLSDLDKNKKRKAISFRCTCGNRFHKQIVRKDFKKIDIISAIAQADFEVLWYKIKMMLLLFGNVKSEKVQLV